MKKNIYNLSLSELKEELSAIVEKMPRYRAEQIYAWLGDYKRISEMTNIPQELRNKLLEVYDDEPVKIERELISRDGTKKYLLSLADGNIVEGVLMNYKYGNTICISTQVGCRMGCAFCATGIDGLVRNLTPAEMLGQVLAVNRHIGGSKSDRKITNIVLMGCGEPLDNYDNVVKFIKLISSKENFNLSQRNISLSTCGLAEKIKALADEDLGITLTISLHASTEEERKKIMPVARGISLKELFFAIRYYFEKTKRRIVFEYITLDMNTNKEDAERLKELSKGISSHFNLIPINTTPHSVEENPALKPASKQKQAEFWEELKKLGVSATTRRTLGSDISGACGQLRRSKLKEGK
ncbi:MAG: 23S rRNA (adenine(2503)-C(2))-methyltransferase RlmN [Clostridia bacterium]|nr:23S rRNA (adenine(2503)-C(2))-methyltransferase RlmN [Clostridia bacterium]